MILTNRTATSKARSRSAESGAAQHSSHHPKGVPVSRFPFRLRGSVDRRAFLTNHSSLVKPRSGFTLIELILVMTILTIAVSLTAPALANFFRGRTLDSEARRLLAATREAQSRAASQGIPVELWFDSSLNKFGIELEPSYEPNAKGEEFDLDKNLQLNVTTLNIGASRANGSFGLSSSSAPTQNASPIQSRHAGLPRIRFMPDGTISEDSPQVVQLIGADPSSISMMLSRSRLNYELQSRQN